MINESISRLLRENQQQLLRERKSVGRKHFVRPVSVGMCRYQDVKLDAFSKDLSPNSIGLICDMAVSVGTIATLEIHSISNRPVRIRSELRSSNAMGSGWYSTNWHFLEI